MPDCRDLPPEIDALLRLLDVDRPVWPLGDMHRAATDQCATACTCAQFRQGHPYGHNVSLSLLARPLQPPGCSVNLLPCDQVTNKRLSASGLPMILPDWRAFLGTGPRASPLTCQSETQ